MCSMVTGGALGGCNLPDERINWTSAIQRRFRREFGEWLPDERISEVLKAAQLERMSGSALDQGLDSTRSLDLLFDDLQSIEEDYERAFGADSIDPATTEQSDWISIVPPPPRWAARTRSIMKRYRPLQDTMLVMLGLDSVVPRDEIATVLATVAASDSQEGDVVILRLPPDSEEEVVVGRLGIHMNPWLSATKYSMERRESPQPDDFPTYDAWLEQHRAGLMQKLTRLGKLSFVVEHIATETGCDAWQATAYLLCGEIPELPWVRARRVVRAAVGETWLIEVGATSVPVKDVQQAWTQAKKALSANESGLRRGASRTQVELYEFVQPLRERDTPWAMIQKAWNKQPGVHLYDKTKTMEVAFLRARRKIES